MRPSLESGEDGAVDAFVERSCGILTFYILREDDRAAWAAQCFMRRCGHDIGVGKWRRMHAAGDEPRDVRNVRHMICAYFFCDRAEGFEVDRAGICGRSRNDEFRPVSLRKP